ncbi:Succinate-semialdehyde dehydrogenase, mitochondrial [Aspergillus nanangensis]|uniref:succinate-semialdehyde dehydrogenase [NAD(P)(+)] n=1 Tax=Aspergillus nanangensis TaxID=2582783 RepID=A0AAD4CBF3_ASPNN|nr:Succinate-semialdehyde dehydrogenase, mitochondrial [Aspergillus nanangensis]
MAKLHLNDPHLLVGSNYIGGQFIPSVSQRTFDVFDPATSLKLGSCPESTPADAQQAIDAAAAAFPAWRSRSGRERSRLLRRWYELIIENKDDLATLITFENGKAQADAAGEVLFAASFVEWFAEEAARIYGEVIPHTSSAFRVSVLKEPVGVCGLITPWNFPAGMVTRKVAPALAAGCTVVLKSAGETPFSANALAVLAARAGVPPGVINIVTALENTPQIGQLLCSSDVVRKVSFTGSTRVGRLLMAQSSSTIKKLSLELGGNAPFIVFEDADLDLAVKEAVTAKFKSSGQTCVCANRIFVHSGIYEAFTRRLAEAVRGFTVGSGHRPGSTHGPLIGPGAVDKVAGLVEDAVEKGAQVVLGGRRRLDLGPCFFEPTILTDIHHEMRITREEIFGPVATISRFESEAEVIDAANSCDVGLAAYVFTDDIQRATRLPELIQSGMVAVNCGSVSDAPVPFGGIKQSGLGREGSKFGMDEYLEMKTQRKACDVCRRRKVRCDIVDQPSGACSVCLRLGVECRSTTRWAKPNRRSINARPARPSTASHVLAESESLPGDHDDRSGSGQEDIHARHEPATGREQLARNGLSRFFKHGINAAAWAVFDSLDSFRIAYVGTAVSNLVHLVQLHRAFRRLPSSAFSPPSPTTASTAAAAGAAAADPSPPVLHYPYPPIRPARDWKPSPSAFSGITATDLALDVASFPAQEIRDALVTAYFTHIHPFHPVISKPEFLAAYYNTPASPPPLLLFQAVLMAGAHACTHPLVSRARHAVKTTLFRRASMLFHLRHETDRVHLMQAAVLFTRHVGDGDTVTGGPWYWSGIAVRIGCGLGMHRHSPGLPGLESAQYRRCWWSAFVCEVLAALETGRPCAVRVEDIDQRPLGEADMTDDHDPDHGLGDDARRGAVFISRMVELAYVGLEILALNEPAPQRIVDVRALDARLCQWSLRVGLSGEDGGGEEEEESEEEESSWDHQLRVHYNLMLLHLHRNYPDEANSRAVCAVAAQAIVGALEKLVALDCLAQCHFSVVSAVTAAGIQLAYEIRAAVAAGSFLVAIHALERLSQLLKPTTLLAAYWPNADAVHSVLHELHQEYRLYVTQGLQGEAVMVPELQPDWYRLLAGAQPAPLDPVAEQDWMNISNWAGLL